MKRLTFITIFVVTHVGFIFFQIHKHTKIIQLSYEKQKLEKHRSQLIAKKQELTQELYSLKSRTAIARFAKKRLKMSKVKLKQIKKLHESV